MTFFFTVINLYFFSDSVGDTFLKDLIGSLLKVGWHVRGKYGPLGCMASIVGATKMLLWFPTIPQELFPFMKERGLVPHVSLVKLECIYCFVACFHLCEVEVTVE